MTTFLAFRETYPFARLMATVINSQGGVSKKPQKKVSDTEPVDWQDFIPPFAHYQPLIELYSGGNPFRDVDPEAVRELLAHKKDIQGMMYSLIDWSAVEEIVGA